MVLTRYVDEFLRLFWSHVLAGYRIPAVDEFR